MYKAVVIATVEYTDGRVKFVTFTGSGTITALKRRIRAKYRGQPDVAHVGLGNGLYRRV